MSDLFEVRPQQLSNDLANYFPGLVVIIRLNYRSVPMFGDHIFGNPWNFLVIGWQR